MKTAELRKKFISFFEARSHQVVPSDSLIPRDDPTLLFTGAGMNQFKDYFLGIKKDMKRAVSVQKCLRTGDLDNVGKTPYHHSFFEMLGNFSFGDYFKDEAIRWAWEFLTKDLGIADQRLRVSVYRDDDEAFGIWEKKIGVRPDWIYQFDDEVNFWPAGVITKGPNGPCGPCSEIYFDQGEKVGCGRPACGVDCDCGRFAEIWNLVFTQFDRQSDGKLVPLKAKNIDTGMGLERLACVLQGKMFNYEIDLFEVLQKEIKNRMAAWDNRFRADVYAVCDHVRAAAFAIGDGAYPSNEGRGYVVRKLIRRALWRSKRTGLKLPVLYELVPSVISAMRDFYADLKENQEYITRVIKNEEERFLRTLERGLGFISAAKSFSSEDVFLLYDTYGFPVELTKLIADERGLPFETDRFEELMEKQRQAAKQTSKISSSIFVADEFKSDLLKRNIKPTMFHGYEKLECGPVNVLALVNENGKFCDQIAEGAEGLFVVPETVFYAEGGGQVGDRGEFILENGKGLGDIVDTFKKEDVFFHRTRIASDVLNVGSRIRLRVNEELRRRTMYNHTATHLLHAALRKILGEHVRQLGSVVEPGRLRFDFSHFQTLTPDEIKRVEDLVNQEIQKATPVSAAEKSIDQAKKEGAIAFFGDKYGSQVRVIAIGNFSKELCGGTHVSNTKEIGRMKIISESSIGSGTRRIEAVTSTAVDEYQQELKLREASDKRRDEKRRIEQAKQIQLESERLSAVDQDKLIASAFAVNGMQILVHHFDGLDTRGLGHLADSLKAKLDKGIVVVFSEERGKLAMAASLTDNLKESSVSANEIVRKIAPLIKGQGGGRKDFAQGGGMPPENRDQFIKTARKIVEAAAAG
ncbi:MAG: alanine--tRNA ligase [Candidatus Omnitrophica bacterium]|nr:alanine--tRNA ligase [Candidatus Omnitrophota bacterium]